MSSERPAFLVDTNVLVYAYDISAGAKQERALATLTRLHSTGHGALSTQVLGEFYVTATRKLSSALTPREAERSVTNYTRSWPVFGVESLTVLEAVRASARYRISYWDALILSTARIHGIPNVLSEDFQDGSLLDGVRFLNPMKPGFNLESLIA